MNLIIELIDNTTICEFEELVRDLTALDVVRVLHWKQGFPVQQEPESSIELWIELQDKQLDLQMSNAKLIELFSHKLRQHGISKATLFLPQEIYFTLLPV